MNHWVILLLITVLYVISFLLYSQKQRRALRKLAQFLNQAQYELPALEASDQQEGEFGILKSESYKLFTRLHAQTELVQKEKEYLADTISDISHQLKTPMTSMSVTLDLLKEDELPQEQREYFIRTLHSQMNRMEWLLSAMLTMSRLDAGTILLKKETVLVDEMLEKALEPLLIPMELRRQSVLRSGAEGTFYTGDMAWSAEAVSNILKNSMEHMAEGGNIQITTSQNEIYTQIEIRDMGTGIRAEDLPHIFERFYRGRYTSKNSVGIGLALAKTLICSQNGNITVASMFGEYTVFTIRFYHCTV